MKVRAAHALFVPLCAVLALAGCHGPVATPVRTPPAPAQLPVTPRGPIAPDVSAVPTDTPRPPPLPDEYRRLTATECRKLAIANAPFTEDLDRHPENDPPSHPRFQKGAARNAESSRLVRGHAADELRNRAAGEALDEFFKLIEAEGQLMLLNSADAEVRARLDDALKAEKAGLKDRADIPAIRRQLLDMEAQRAKLEAGIGALNASLRARLNLVGNDPLSLWPIDPLKVRPEEVDIEQAVATGLHYRPDLNLLRVLAEGSAADLADGMLKSANPLLARTQSSNPIAILLAPIFAPFTGKPAQARAETIARVAGLLTSRERQAEAEIRAAVASLHGHRAAVAARTLDVQQVQAKVAELETRQKAGLSVTAELTTARLDLLKAKGSLLTASTDWHSAEAKLRQAMGLLVRE